MLRLRPLLALVSLLSSSALAQETTCRTDDSNCQGYAQFGPARIDRCISIRGQSRTDFCQTIGDTQRVLIQPGDQYCAVAGGDPPPDQCDLRWITVTEPQ